MGSKLITISLFLLSLFATSIQFQEAYPSTKGQWDGAPVTCSVERMIECAMGETLNATLRGCSKACRSLDVANKEYRKRQYEIDEAYFIETCKQSNNPTLFTFEDCVDQYLYCSGSGVSRWSFCPFGETFNRALGACSKTCKKDNTTSRTAVFCTITANIDWSEIEDGVKMNMILRSCSKSTAAQDFISNNSTTLKLFATSCSSDKLTEFSSRELVKEVLRGCSKNCRRQNVSNQPKKQIDRAEVLKYCQQFKIPTFITFGDCFDQYVYCSQKGIHKWAYCATGEIFNKALGTCVKKLSNDTYERLKFKSV